MPIDRRMRSARAVPTAAVTRLKRLALGATVMVGLVLLGACSAEDKRQIEHLAMPGLDPRNVTETSHYVFDLWKWGWVAAMVTGVITWALIFYAAWAFRRRSDDEVPVQTRYNLPLEIFYTIAPVIMVVVFFFHTVQAQNGILEEDPNPDVVVDVVGQKWSWTFNYPGAVDGQNVFESGTAGYVPTLVLPVDQTVEFKLYSPDVIHSFWITGFLMKMDVVPGKDPVNSFQVTPKQIGDFRGKCAELCGVSHSRMLFNVKVVSQADYETYLQTLVDKGNVSDEPIIGGAYAYEPVEQVVHATTESESK